jgi:hypothetical protein
VRARLSMMMLFCLLIPFELFAQPTTVTELCANLDKIRCVTSSTVGADLGAKVNTADASLGPSAGEIWIDSSAGTTWTTATTFSGPRKIRFVNGATYFIPMGNVAFTKPVIWDCGGRQNAIMNFTGSGTAMLINWAQFPQGSFADGGYGFRDCQLIGPGGTNGVGNAGTAFQVGDATHASIHLILDDLWVCGFATGITWGNVSAWGTEIRHTTFCNNDQDFQYNLSVPGGTEQIVLNEVTFNQTGVGPMVANDFEVAGISVAEINCFACSFDNSQINIHGSAKNVIRFLGKHHEVTTNSSVTPMLISSGLVDDDDMPLFQADGAKTAPASFVALSGGTYSVRNATWRAQAGAPVAQAILKSSTGNLIAQNPLLLVSNVDGITNGGTGYLYNCDPANGFCNLSGGSFGAAFFRSLSANSAVTGQLRLASNDAIVFRNHANNGDIPLSKNAGDELLYGTLKIPQVLAKGISALGTVAIAPGTCGATVSIDATGATTTSVVHWSPASDLNTASGYAGSEIGAILQIYAFPTSNKANFRVCNNTSKSIKPGPMSVNWDVTQ